MQTVDTDGGQIGRILGPFHAFCHGKHVELSCDGGQRRGQDLIVHILCDAANKLAVDLENVETEVSQIAEGGKSGAEIIQCKTDPPFGQIVHEANHQLGHQHGRAFGNFQNQPLPHGWIKVQSPTQGPHPSAIADGSGGHVQRHP